MTRVEALEKAVGELKREEYRRFRKWFLERDWEKWDMQIEEDSSSGNLNFLLEEAVLCKNKNKLKSI